MAKKKLPKGITLTPGGRYKVGIQTHGVRKHIGYFDTLEEAQENLGVERKEHVAKKLSPVPRGNEAVQRLLSKVAFDDLMQWAEANGGIIDTSPGSEFNIWCRAADEARVGLQEASELFVALNDCTFDDETAMAALESPGPFVKALREIQKYAAGDVIVWEIARILSATARLGGRATVAQAIAQHASGLIAPIQEAVDFV